MLSALALDWFPQQYATALFLTKGGLALTATLLYLAHMDRAWHTITTAGQRWRYVALLYLAILLTAASAEQVQEDTLVSLRHVGALIGAALVFVAALMSLRDDAHRNP